MEHISEKEWQNLAELSKLYITQEETMAWKADVENILTYIKSMTKLHTKEQIFGSDGEGENVIRKDQIGNPNGQKDTLRNAPDCSQNMFRVPDCCGRRNG